MAILDPTYLARARNLFPEFTELQFHVISLSCGGYYPKEIAEHMHMTVNNVYKTLRMCRTKVKAKNAAALRNTIFLRLMFSPLLPLILGTSFTS